MFYKTIKQFYEIIVNVNAVIFPEKSIFLNHFGFKCQEMIGEERKQQAGAEQGQAQVQVY